MKLSIATNFENSLIDQVKDLSVSNVFGKLSGDFVGGGLENDLLNTIDQEIIANHVKYAHANGITVNYTFNSPCLANDEYTLQGKKELNNLLEWIVETEIDSLTISIPVLVKYVKKAYPHLQVKVSSSVCVDSVSKARRWEEMGADSIVLDPMVVNRDFQMLKAIRDSVKLDLELIINNNCMYECPFLPYHQAFLGHSSRGDFAERAEYDYCYLNCSQKRVSNPVHYLIADWIRPEDLHHYEELGYDTFKIIDRATPTEELIKRARAYHERHFEGNWLEIIQHYGYRDLAQPAEFLQSIYIDNRKLDGYLDRFLQHKCFNQNCGTTCRYCYEFASQAIRIDLQFKEDYLSKSQAVLDKVEALLGR